MIAERIMRPVDVEAFPADLFLPEVKIASDGKQMREIFQQCLKPTSKKTYLIKDCVVTRIRHRKGARCILQYDLCLRDSESGGERIQWASGVIYPSNRARHIWKKLCASELKVDGMSQTFEPFTFIPDLKMLVQLFPYDHRLPALKQMINGPSRETETLLLDQFGPGSWYVEAVNVEPIRYRAGLAVVLQYAVQAREKVTGQQLVKRFYAKIYRDERGEEIYRLLRALWEKRSLPGEHFTIGKPVAYLNESRALFQEEASGDSLQKILIESQDLEVVEAARKVARALARLHLDQIPTTRRHLLQDEIAILEARVKTLQWACPDLKEELEKVISQVVASLKEVPLSPAHLDLKTDHILLDGSSYSLLDFDSFALADPVLDAAHVMAQVFGLQFGFPVAPYRLRMAANAFADEYFAHVPGEWESRLRSNYPAALLKVAVGFFRRQEQNWSQKVVAMIEEAKASLAGENLRNALH